MPETPRSAATFTPIAIVGRACLLPGAGSPAELAELVFARRDAITSVEHGRWGLARERVMSEHLSGGPIPGAPPEMGNPLNLTPHETGLQGWSAFRSSLLPTAAAELS